MSDIDGSRYIKQIGLPEVGRKGQERLNRARVLIVGVGGLGCPAALYLAAAGVGQIGLVDGDTVECSNLHRQILYQNDDIGHSKVEVAARRLLAIDPQLKVDAFPFALDAHKAPALFDGYDLILDCTDNFSTRYLINDVSVLGNRPFIYGSVDRFKGQLALLGRPDGPCFRCLFPFPEQLPPTHNCAEGGVLGVVPGLIGTLQATEALKVLLQIRGNGGSLLSLDTITLSCQKTQLKKDPDCPICSETPSLVDLSHLRSSDQLYSTVRSLDPKDFLRMLQSNDPASYLIDVRRVEEYETDHIEGANLIPLDRLSNELPLMNKKKPILFYCQSGGRSKNAAQTALALGFERVYDLRGGLAAYRLINPPL